MGGVVSRLAKAPELKRAQILDLKGDSRFDEGWLERLICDNPEILGLGKVRLLSEQKHDYLLQGHTHVRHDERIGKTRVINPGALHRAREKTVALLDTATDRLVFLPVF